MASIPQLTNTGWDEAKRASTEQNLEQQRIAEEDRMQRQAKISAIVGDSLNALPLPKDENGNPDLKNPAYNDILQRRQQLISSLMDQYTPVQHANIIQRIGGLITGNPKHAEPHPNQPLPAMGTGPAAQAAGQAAAQSAQAQQDLQNSQPQPAAPPAPSGPPHPFATDHPVLSGIQTGLKALGNHLQAFAHPNLPKPDNSALVNSIASSYQDPAQLAHERSMEIWGLRGKNALEVQRLKNEYLMQALNLRPPRFLAQSTIPDLLKQMEVDPEMTIYGPDGKQLSPAQLKEMPPGTIAREFQAGSRTFYALGDQNSKTLNVNGKIFDIPSIGQIAISGPDQNATPIGQATSTLPKTSTSTVTDPFNLKTTTARESQTVVPQTPTPAPAPVPGAPPTLQTRPGAPVSSAAPAPPTTAATPPAPNSLAAVNDQIQQAKLTSKKLTKGQPTSANAPLPPSVPLDDNGHIPQGVGNDLVRQFANEILDGRDPKEIPNPKAQAAALAMVEKAVPGYSRGAFTPREKIQFQTAITFLKQLEDSPALKVLDSYASREKLAQVMKDPSKSTFWSRLAATFETGPEAELVRNMQAAAGVVQGLSGITRSGKPTNAGVATLKTELPNVFQTTSSKDAKARIENLLKEADIALSTNPRDVGKAGPVSQNAPQVGQWKPPADAPAAPKEDGKALKADGKVIAVSKGGQWAKP